VDTRLFVDPFLVYEREEGPFEGAHDEIIAFFNSAFHLIARAKGDHLSLSYRRAVDMLRLPEVQEICLGYSAGGTRGAGSGGGIARIVAEAIWEAIEEGTKEITHFEEISILREGIGADRISDVTAAILRHRLAAYTKTICDAHGVETEAFRYLRGRYRALSRSHPGHRPNFPAVYHRASQRTACVLPALPAELGVNGRVRMWRNGQVSG
jgi:hypothetical protein